MPPSPVLRNRSTNSRSSPAVTVLLVFVVAVLVNLPWELAQIGLGLFADTSDREMVFCLTCSIGDGLLVLLILGAGRLAFGAWDWFVRAAFREYGLMVSVGAVLATTIELAAVGTGTWRYERAMPLLPGVRVGLFPFLQMIMLPPIIFRLVAVFRRRSGATV